MPIPAGGASPIIAPTWAPSVEQVADHVPYLTVDTVTPGSQEYLNTFNDRTNPTNVQAQRLIDGVWPVVAAAVGAIVEQVWPLAQHVTALRAAAAVVRAYPRDDGDLPHAAALDARADADLLRLIAANDAAGGGAGNSVDLLPVYSFPAAVSWGDQLL